MDQQQYALIGLGVLLVGLYLWSCSNAEDDGKTKEGFWWYSPCIYNAQNRLVCNNSFRGYNWMWGLPSRYTPSLDLRGDQYWPYFSSRYGSFFRYPWLA